MNDTAGVPSNIGRIFLAAAVALFCAATLTAQSNDSAQQSRGERVPAAEEEGGAGDASTAKAPTVELRGVHIRKNRPDEVFHHAGTELTFWVRDGAGRFQTLLDNETAIRRFEDDRGTDLVREHRRQITQWEQDVQRLRGEGHFVSMGRSRELYSADAMDPGEDAAGFYLTVESWGLPAAEAEKLHLAADISYVVGTEETELRVFEEINLRETKIVRIGEYGIRPSDFQRDGGKRRFTLYTELPLNRFEIRNLEGATLGGIIYTRNGRPVVEIPAGSFDDVVQLVVSYQAPKRRSISIDRRVDVGL